MLGTTKTAERAVLLYFVEKSEQADEVREEFLQLAISAGLAVVGSLDSYTDIPNSKYLIGGGKVDALRNVVGATQADVVLVDHFLTPSQERNLERAVGCRVLDRTRLILDIFAQRATTFEGKLQVELAQLRHLSTRLIRGWTHLERQKGGIGLRGPGETQLETDRRLIKVRIAQLQRRILRVRQSRALAQRSRTRSKTPLVALVGYTNAGKSTLFNRLTGAAGYTADRLFATLDPLARRVQLSGIGDVVFSDTVGFIRDLPHDLVAAFGATLEQVRQADLLLHVVDAQPSQRDERIATVRGVIAELGAAHVPTIEVFNKVDLLQASSDPSAIEATQETDRLRVSAQTGSGITDLLDLIVRRLQPAMARAQLRLTPQSGRLRAELYAMGVVASESFDEEGVSIMEVSMPSERLQRMLNSDATSVLLAMR